MMSLLELYRWIFSGIKISAESVHCERNYCLDLDNQLNENKMRIKTRDGRAFALMQFIDQYKHYHITTWINCCRQTVCFDGVIRDIEINGYDDNIVIIHMQIPKNNSIFIEDPADAWYEAIA